MNDENLIPFNKLSKDSHKEIARLGGIASGKARRRKAAFYKQARETMRNLDFFEELTEQEYQDFKRWQKQQKKTKNHK